MSNGIFRLIFNGKNAKINLLKTKTSVSRRGFLGSATNSDHLELIHYYMKSFFSFKQNSHSHEIFFQWPISIKSNMEKRYV